MKLRKYLILVVFGVSSLANATVYQEKEIQTIHSPDSRPCSFFRLVGITEADQVVASNPWFSVPLDHQGHDVIISILLAANASNSKVNVTTTGSSACGHAEVSGVSFHH